MNPWTSYEAQMLLLLRNIRACGVDRDVWLYATKLIGGEYA